MKNISKYLPFFISALLMYAVLCLIYPNYQYYIDPDGTAYLTISKRYAAGDWTRAINGYWSPWNCWLTALLIKQGIQAIPASVIINALGATGFLYLSQSFFLKFNIQRWLQWLFQTTLVVFLCYAIFWQSFDDLWECFFLLGALRIMLSERFVANPVLWIASGLLGALAYFAKSYSFPFFILNTICCTYLICKSDKIQWLKIAATAIFTMALFSLPWIVALHNKYGIWTTSTAGSLNLSWYLVRHPYWKEGIDILLPPVYGDSPYYWEDPYMVNGPAPHFWNSFQLFGMQILRAGYNMWKLLLSMLQLSVLFPAVAVAALIVARSKKIRAQLPASMYPVAISFLLFPLGYLLVNFEARYLWYMVLPGMVMGAWAIQHYAAKFRVHTVLLSALFALSFAAYPVYGLIELNHKGYNEYNLGERFATYLHGSFTSNVAPGVKTQEIVRIAYFANLPYYANPSQVTDDRKLLADMRRNRVKYYVFFCDTATANYQFKDERGLPFPQVSVDKGECIKVFVVNP